MKMKIVADSSANLLSLPDIDFGVVPLHIIVGENDYIDDDKIDLTDVYKRQFLDNVSQYHSLVSPFTCLVILLFSSIVSTPSTTPINRTPHNGSL